MHTLLQPLQNGMSTLASYIPQLVGALIILIIGYIIAKIVQAVVTRVLKSLGFENWMERGGVKQFFDRAQTNQTPSSILGKVAFWFIFIIAITMTANALGIQQVTGFLNRLIAYIPDIFAAILILLLATLLANFVAGIVRGATGSGLFGSITRYAIVIYAVFAALTQLGIAVHLTSNTFLIILAGVALAAAIAFGWGARNVAQDIVERAYNNSGRVRQRMEQQRQQQSGSGSQRQRGGGRSSGGSDGSGRYEGRDIVKMSDSDFVPEDRRYDIRGREVRDRDGNAIGRVRDLYIDENEQRARFLDIEAGGTLGVGKKHFLVPYEAVTGMSDDRITLDQDRDRVTDSPKFDEAKHPDRAYQARVYRHYGYS